MTSTNKTRKTAIKASDLAILAMMSGADALDSKLVGHTNPVAVLDKVIATFEAYGKDTADLVVKRDLFANARGNGVKGRKAPIVGEVRGYSVQRIGSDGDLFIRLPLTTLNGVSKGAKVNVTFGASGISVALAFNAENAATDESDDLADDSDSELDDDSSEGEASDA